MDHDQKRQLLQLNEQLIQVNQRAHQQFVQKTRSEGYEMDFYGEVKPFADKVLALVDEWRPLVDEWIKSDHPKYIYAKQINDTYDNLTIVSVTCFQKDTRRRRFLETIKSIDYVLNAIQQQFSYN
ncbi:hypothetical protein GCM10011391_17380 [Pullulanibacillus camelliae]|uniref:DUF1798 family protein n=1 Tax=Pullulanibacillus camelliae TaxID=1707096 RepID=A0A8J2VYH4_9BACL|nr:YppE family protein [Pullulanibacillus camelliae]GGE39100.1 hypothetical protein GCM10011391_17380 [Pullulanibacillus camelliae]